jgi:hypothetical protein
VASKGTQVVAVRRRIDCAVEKLLVHLLVNMQLVL